MSDLVEEFRAPSIERLAAGLVNNREVVPEMFVRQDEGGRPIVAAGRHGIIRGDERWLDRRVRSPRSVRLVLWRRLVEERVVAYAQHLRGVAPYTGYTMDS